MMKVQKHYSPVKSYLAMGMITLALTSLNVHAIGHKNEQDKHHADQHHKNANLDEDQQAKMKKRFHRLTKKLALSAEQRREIKVIFTQMKEGRQANKAAMSGFKAQVKSLLQASEFDENQFDAIYAEFHPSFQNAAMEKAKNRHAFLQVLTPVQQQKYLTMRRSREGLF